jgi:phage shock protein C
MDKRLKRSSHDCQIAGVAAGVAEYMNINPVLIRLLFAALTFFADGFGIVAYLVLWLVMPQEESKEKIHVG